jgi:uncharacterized protein (UPF0128 family)
MNDPKEVFRTPTGALFCNQNDMEQHQDGGRVTLTLLHESEGTKELYFDKNINSVGVTINFMRDNGMDVFPTNKAGMVAKRYTLIILEE